MTGQYLAPASEPAREALLERIAALESETAQLRARLADNRVAESLAGLLADSAIAGALAAPTDHDDLLEQIVATAAHVLHANAAALFLVDEAAEELVFQVALGEKAPAVKQFRLPLGQGIAGFAAATGQALAISDAQQDPRWAGEIGRAVDYLPGTILAVPLLHDGRVVGVLELLDKAGGVPFDMADMATAGQFAQQAAVAIAQSAVSHDLTSLLRAALAGLDGHDGTLLNRAAAVAGRTTARVEFQETLQIASTLGAISRGGDAARRLCAQIVAALDAYLESQVGGERRQGRAAAQRSEPPAAAPDSAGGARR